MYNIHLDHVVLQEEQRLSMKYSLSVEQSHYIKRYIEKFTDVKLWLMVVCKNHSQYKQGHRNHHNQYNLNHVHHKDNYYYQTQS